MKINAQSTVRYLTVSEKYRIVQLMVSEKFNRLATLRAVLQVYYKCTDSDLGSFKLDKQKRFVPIAVQKVFPI